MSPANIAAQQACINAGRLAAQNMVQSLPQVPADAWPTISGYLETFGQGVMALYPTGKLHAIGDLAYTLGVVCLDGKFSLGEIGSVIGKVFAVFTA